MHVTLVHDLALVLGVAAVTSVLSRLARQPSVLGYLFAGLIVGPYLPIPIFADPQRVETLAELGVVLVMFGVGLEFRLARLVRMLPVSGLTVLIEAGTLVWAGVVTGQLLGWSSVESLFLGTSIAISSTMVVSRVLDQEAAGADVRESVLGVLVIQDVLAILVVAVMTAVAVGGGLAPAELASTLGRLATVLAAMLLLGLAIVPRVVRATLRLRSTETTVVLLLGLCFVLAALAQELGYSVALGAFLAGLLVAESGRGGRVEPLIAPLRDVFAAIFFVSVGMTVEPRAAWEHLPLSLLVFAIVVVGQLASVLVAGLLSGFGLRRAVLTGLSLGQIGEFAFIISAIGVAAGVVEAPLVPVLVSVAVLTAFTTPLLLARGERIAGFLDRALPRRIRTVLGLYESWLERWRSSLGGSQESRPPVSRATRAIGLDALGMILVLAATARFGQQVADWLGTLGVPYPLDRLLVGAAVVLLTGPLLYGIVRNGLALARLASSSVLSDPAGSDSRAALTQRTLGTILALAILLGAGLPAIAILRPLTGRFYGVLLLASAAVPLALRAWRTAGRVATEFHSGAAQVAALLATQETGPEDDERKISSPSLVPGLDAVFRFQVAPGTFAVGRTLAELDVRARTGATVVAIHRPGSDLVLPTGRERLQVDDALAIAATHEAFERARVLLTEGSPAGAHERPHARQRS